MDNLTKQNCINSFKAACDKFPQDKKYRETLARAIELDPQEAYLLRPVIGQNELKYLLENAEEKNFMPGIRHDYTVMDSHDNKYLKSGEFKINLHIHTKYSDGILEIEDFLQHAAELADKNYTLNPTEPPLLIAITDHDCIDGAKEILTKLSKDPFKYKNVRLVLGIEISTISNKFHKLKQPVQIHTHMFCINPFDKQLNDFINQKRELKLKLAQNTITKLNKELKPILNKFDINLTMEDAAKVHPILLKGQDEIKAPLVKYICSKLLFSHLVLYNDEFLKILYSNNINPQELGFDKPIMEYKSIFKKPGNIFKRYKAALKIYLTDFFKDKTQKTYNFSEILNLDTTETEHYIEKGFEIAKQAHPTLTTMPKAFAGFEQTLETLSKLDFGVFGIAHPGRTTVTDFENSLEELFENMFETFKTYGKERAAFYEGYYQSYYGTAYLDYLLPIDNAAKKCKLLKSGGLDSHGPNITTRHPWP